MSDIGDIVDRIDNAKRFVRGVDDAAFGIESLTDATLEGIHALLDAHIEVLEKISADLMAIHKVNAAGLREKSKLRLVDPSGD